jgi:hypothetical protein
MVVATLHALVASHEGKLSALQSTLLATLAENELLKRKPVCAERAPGSAAPPAQIMVRIS